MIRLVVIRNMESSDTVVQTTLESSHLKIKRNITGLANDNPRISTNVVDDISEDDTPKVWFRILYLGRPLMRTFNKETNAKKTAQY